jgi:hypothetical protein
MKRTLVCACLAIAALTIATPSTAALPRHGVLVVGRSLGGVQLGDSAPSVREKLGDFYGVCDGCAETTWYFTYRPYAPEGVGVTFRRGHVVAVFTLWRPPGWRTADGVRLGDEVSRVTGRYGRFAEASCGSYSGISVRRGSSVTVFYVVDARLWGFGLLRPSVAVCR